MQLKKTDANKTIIIEKLRVHLESRIPLRQWVLHRSAADESKLDGKVTGADESNKVTGADESAAEEASHLKHSNPARTSTLSNVFGQLSSGGAPKQIREQIECERGANPNRMHHRQSCRQSPNDIEVVAVLKLEEHDDQLGRIQPSCSRKYKSTVIKYKTSVIVGGRKEDRWFAGNELDKLKSHRSATLSIAEMMKAVEAAAAAAPTQSAGSKE